MINLSCLPPPQSISLTSQKPKRCLENLLFISRKSENRKVVKSGGIWRKRFFYVMFVLNPKRKGQLLCLWVPVREWSDMLTLLQGFAKNPTLLLFIWVLSNKQNSIFGQQWFCKKTNLFICDLPCCSCQLTNRQLIWITDNVVKCTIVLFRKYECSY